MAEILNKINSPFVKSLKLILFVTMPKQSTILSHSIYSNSHRQSYLIYSFQIT